MAENTPPTADLDADAFRSTFQTAWKELLPVFESMVMEKITSKDDYLTTDRSKIDPKQVSSDNSVQKQNFDPTATETNVSEDDSSDSDSESDPGDAAHSSIDPALVTRLKKVVVNIEQYVQYALGSENVGAFTGTGVIVDKRNGIILTNLHIAGQSPQRVKVTFENGDTCSAIGPLHGDPWHDFAFYKFDPESIEFEFEEARLTTSFHLKEQDEVFMIGNNEGEGYSVKYGRVVNLKLNRGDRHSAAFQTSFDRTGGSSGSPVFDVNGNVVGLHMRGTETTSIELRIEYVTDALEQMVDKDTKLLKIDFKVKRGEIGVVLELRSLAECVKHLRFPPVCAQTLRSTYASTHLKHALIVQSIIPFSEAEESGLRPGDIVWKLNEQLIGDNMYLFDKIVDRWVGGYVTFVFFRNGQQMTLKVEIRDAMLENKISKFALLAGGVFHNVTPFIRHQAEIACRDGVYLSQVAIGSSVCDLGTGSNKHPTKFMVMIEALDGKPTRNLDEFIQVVKDLTRDSTNQEFSTCPSDPPRWIGNSPPLFFVANYDFVPDALCRNYREISVAVQPVLFTLDIKFGALRVFSFDKQSLEWKEQSL